VNSSWVPTSAGALVTGVLALFAGVLLLPATGGDTAETLRMVREEDGRWLGVGVMLFLGGAGMMLGLPACMVLFRRRGRVLGGIGVVVMALAAAATAGYAMLVVFFRALVLSEAIRPDAFDAVLNDTGLTIMLLGWVVSFYVGELLLAVAVLRSGTVARWIPGVLIAHVALWPVSMVLPDEASTFTVGLVVLGFCGLAFGAVAEAERTLVDRAPSMMELPRALG